ncbi:MAG TPA: hypothetical protein VGP93_04185, partial [Polyangiaceae bacterium]|nr:hypothetical protein [Polyangiaceae bacterium]
DLVRTWSCRAVTAYAQGNHAEYLLAAGEFEKLPHAWHTHNTWFGRCFAMPFLKWLDGDQDAMTRACAAARETFEVEVQSVWYFGRLLSGEIDEAEFDAQPMKFLREAKKAVALALRAELAGERGIAREHYARFLQLPRERRIFDQEGEDPVLDAFVEFRFRVLTVR